MPDIQQQTDVEMARARLEGVTAGNEEASQTSLLSPKPKVEPRIKPVTKKPKKKSFGEKMKEAFFGDIGDGSITEHIFFNIFVPSFKRVLADMANTAINMALNLDPRTRTIGSAPRNHVANASLYRDRNANRGGVGYPGRDDLSDYAWDEDTAKYIYEQMLDLMEQSRRVTRADVYSIMDMKGKIRSTDNSWGWTSMNHIDFIQNGDDWYIDFPPAKALY